MKIFKKFLFSLGIIAIPFLAQSQNNTSTKSNKRKLTKTDVPQVVVDTFTAQFPATVYNDWYGSPLVGEESEWHFINPDPEKSDAPEYFVTEFRQGDIPYRVVYKKDGKKVITAKGIKDGDLPKKVLESFNKSNYKNWKQHGSKEELIYGDGKTRVFRITVEKGKEQHFLYFDEQGKLLKDQKINA